MTGIIILVVLVVLIFVGVPVGFSLGLAGAVGLAVEGITDPIQITQHIYGGLESFPLVAIPMFLLMANLMDAGGITGSLVNFTQDLVGGIRGSLAVGAVGAGAFMGGISGSSLADTTSVGAIMIPAMKSQGYPPAFASAVVAGANIVGPIIPPSILMVLYGFATNQPIIALFLAGVVPGILLVVVYAITAYVLVIRRDLGPPKGEFHFNAVARSAIFSLPAMVVPFVIIVGVLGGVFTVTESAAAAAGYALVYAFLYAVLHQGKGVSKVIEAFARTYRDTAVVAFLIGGSALLAVALTFSGLPDQLVAGVSGLHLPQFALLLVLNVIMIVMGSVLEPAASILIIATILVPLVQIAGLSLIQFGVISVVNLQIGTLTPPVGTSPYITSRIAGVEYEKVIKELLVWLAVSYPVLLLVTYIPVLTLWLPRALHAM